MAADDDQELQDLKKALQDLAATPPPVTKKKVGPCCDDDDDDDYNYHHHINMLQFLLPHACGPLALLPDCNCG